MVTSEIKLKQNILFQFYFSFISDVTIALGGLTSQQLDVVSYTVVGVHVDAKMTICVLFVLRWSFM